MNNILYISHENSSTYDGWLSKNLSLILANHGASCYAIPEKNSINLVVKNQNYIYNSNIDTIIQYLSIDRLEYIYGYKNIAIFNPKHFIFRNRSIINKLNIFDEVWVFEDMSKVFLSEHMDKNKIFVKAYPYLPQEVSKLFTKAEPKKDKQIFNFYTITNLNNQNNIENLIFNFVTTFHKTRNVRLIIYINNENLKLNIDEDIKQIIKRVRSSFTYITEDSIADLITIITGNIWLDKDTYVKLHISGDCFINIDYQINPHALTACFLRKYALSINHMDQSLKFNSNFIIKSYRDSYKHSVKDDNKIFFNEFNLYPRIIDESIKEKYLMIYELYKSKIDSRSCYENLNTNLGS